MHKDGSKMVIAGYISPAKPLDSMFMILNPGQNIYRTSVSIWIILTPNSSTDPVHITPYQATYNQKYKETEMQEYAKW